MEKRILFGGDYNPEQWLDRPDILEEDIRLMKRANINVATLGVFSWSILEPEEGTFEFDWLEEIIDRLYENGIRVVLATPSGARPVWLDEKYKEALRMDRNGVRHLHGIRHNHCMTSPRYREKVRIIDRKLAERFGNHPAILLWHISNEFGGECFCPLCQKKFQDYLSEKFDGDIKRLNEAWWTTFWSHRYQKFSQIEPPFDHGEISIMGLNLEWKRFTTWNMTDFMKEEIAVFRELTPNIPVTTNFMKLYPGLDYRVMERELDVVTWDSYPHFHNDYEAFYETAVENSFDHAVMRGMKPERPFLMMESAPGLVNWHPVNKLQRPGIYRLMALQAVANGADAAMYFQWRKGRGSFEQYHGAIIDHIGRDDTRIYKEVCRTGEMLSALAEVSGSVIKAEAAVLFDWDNRWAIDDMKGLSGEQKRYEEVCLQQYRILRELGLEVDVVSRDDDLSRYKLVAAPMLYLLGRRTAEHLRSYTLGGGQLVATYLTGYVDENTLCYLGGFPGDGLGELFGIYAEEIDSLYPSDKNEAVFTDGVCSEIRDFAELIKIREQESGAEVIARYASDFYAGMPVVTKKEHGDGTAWYVGARLSEDGMAHIYRTCAAAAGLRLCNLPKELEHHRRWQDGVCYDFYLNHGDTEISVAVEPGVELLHGTACENTVTVQPYDGAVIRCGNVTE